MRGAAENSFLPITSRLEGLTPFGYLDVKGLWTSGIGNLLDTSVWSPELGRSVAPEHGHPWEPMVAVQWFRNDNQELATEREKIIEWCWIWGSNKPDEPLDYDPKTNPFRKQRLMDAMHGGFYFRKFGKLHLTDAGVAELVHGKLASNETRLRERFSEWDAWPASAQLGLHLLAWACGANFRFPHLEGHLRKKEFAIYAIRNDDGVDKRNLVGGAAVECKIDDAGNAGVRPRNAIMRQLFEEAQFVQQAGLDPDALHYPNPITYDMTEVRGDSTPPIAHDQDPDDTAPYSEDTLLGLGTMNPDFIEQDVKRTQDDADKKRGESE